MLEIEEKIPHYICENAEHGIERNCLENGKPCYWDCHHVTNPGFAKNKETVDIFNKFCDTFHVCVDDYGRLLCTEKEASHDG